jgi:hypothetical protein
VVHAIWYSDAGLIVEDGTLAKPKRVASGMKISGGGRQVQTFKKSAQDLRVIAEKIMVARANLVIAFDPSKLDEVRFVPPPTFTDTPGVFLGNEP